MGAHLDDQLSKNEMLDCLKIRLLYVLQNPMFRGRYTEARQPIDQTANFLEGCTLLRINRQFGTPSDIASPLVLKLMDDKLSRTPI
jgi:hypothetical protein